VDWRCLPFDQLGPAQLYALLVLRQRVFVVEQSCPYLDCDGNDPAAWHLWAEEQGGPPLAYVRILPPGEVYPEPAIGRVVTAPEVRRTGLGQELMRRAIAETQRLFGAVPIQIGAQLYLRRFYEGLGFVQTGGVYDEDGIDHVHMIREPNQ